MALIESPSSFKKHIRAYSSTCGECDKVWPAGHEWLVSMDGGRIFKWVCSEECREMFDDRYWQDRADDRQAQDDS